MQIDIAIQNNELMVSKLCDDRRCHQQFIKKCFFKIAVFLKLQAKSCSKQKMFHISNEVTLSSKKNIFFLIRPLIYPKN